MLNDFASYTFKIEMNNGQLNRSLKSEIRTLILYTLALILIIGVEQAYRESLYNASLDMIVWIQSNAT
jgi:hypothetical protein